MYNEQLPNFSAALEAGLPDDAALNSSDMIEQYNETDSTQYVNFIKNKGLAGGLLGAAAGIGGTLLITDLVNKNKRKKDEQKRRAEEERQKAEAEANAQQQAAAAAELAAQTPPPAPPKKDNTMLYVGVGVGALVLFVGVIALARR